MGQCLEAREAANTNIWFTMNDIDVTIMRNHVNTFWKMANLNVLLLSIY